MASSYWFGNPDELIIRTLSVCGPTFDSFRSELDEMNHFMDLIHSLPENLPAQTFTFSLDNEAAVLFGNSPQLQITAAKIDKTYFAPRLHLLTRLLNTKHTVNFEWVKSNQMTRKNGRISRPHLTTTEKNNVLCDREARKFAAIHRSQELPSQRPAGLKMVLC